MKKILLFVCLLVIAALILNSFFSLPCAANIKSSGAIFNCISQGGKWKSGGKSGCGCFNQTNDAGKLCLSNKDCQGECLAPENAKDGESVTGKCSKYGWTAGCHPIIEGGKAVTICVD